MKANTLVIIVILIAVSAVVARDVVISPPAVYYELIDGGWDVSPQPIFNSDSTRVLWDRNVNSAFTDGELEVLRGYLDVEIFVANLDTVAAHKLANGWEVAGD